MKDLTDLFPAGSQDCRLHGFGWFQDLKTTYIAVRKRKNCSDTIPAALKVGQDHPARRAVNERTGAHGEISDLDFAEQGSWPSMRTALPSQAVTTVCRRWLVQYNLRLGVAMLRKQPAGSSIIAIYSQK